MGAPMLRIWEPWSWIKPWWALVLRRDVSFYGNKLFQSTFIDIIAPGSSILTGLLWTLLNSFVALVRILVSD